MKCYIKLMRVHHYIKNLLVFTALICSGQFFEKEKLKQGCIAFIAFCFISSVVYIINDICDVEKDRCHVTKCKRPIASGEISVKNAVILAVILFLVSVCCSIKIGTASTMLLLLLYFVLNLAYSFGLKKIPIVDVFILVSGFLIRIIYGAMVTEIEISNWLYLTVMTLSLFLALGKRRNELKYVGDNNTRVVLKAYSIDFLDKSMYMSLTLANVFYALWSMDEKTVALYGSEYLVYTVPIILLITMKYSFNIEGNSDGDPVEVLLHDKVLILLCLIYAVVMFGFLYM